MAFLGAVPTHPAPRSGALEGRGNRARAVRAADRAGSTGGGNSERDQDEAVLSSVEAVDLERPVAGPSANDSEDGHEDRAQHGAYAPDPRTKAGRGHGTPRPRLDLQG
ncbi:MAG: hypothetical protein ACKVZJ_07825 [Phycisphaerales bacterium]